MNPADFQARLLEYARWAENALRHLVPPVSDRPTTLHAAIHHSLFAGGKRLRPILCAATAEACGAPRDVATHPAAAIECLHTYTLIHDDLPCMDDDDLRRGVPTCHKLFGEAIALLAGDALQALAFQMAAATPLPSALNLTRELAAAAGPAAVVGGQVEDMLAEHLPPDEDRLHFIQRHKTGDLIRCACRMGVLAAGAPPNAIHAASLYGDALGEAFQIADDLLDVSASAAALGKTPGKDAAQGKTTAISVYGLDGAKARLATRIHDAENALADFPGDTDFLAALALHVMTRGN